MHFNGDRVRANAACASTEELLNRVTVYRAGMDAQALPIIEAELERRGIGREEIEGHSARHKEGLLIGPDGVALGCSFCSRPAVRKVWGWHRVWGVVPVFPRVYYYCEEHQFALGERRGLSPPG